MAHYEGNITLRTLSTTIASRREETSLTPAELETAREGFTANYLSFIQLLWEYNIPTIHASVLRRTSETSSTTGLLGKGGQYAVDEVHGNQRYTNAASNQGIGSVVVYKRLLDGHEQEGTSILQESTRLGSFVRELRVLGSLRSHPNIVQILGLAWEGGGLHDISPILILEFASLGSLAIYLNANRSAPIDCSLKWSICQDIASGLDVLHETGLVWGDCKPENVLMFRNSTNAAVVTAKLSDFGCSVTARSGDVRMVGKSPPWDAPETDINNFEDLIMSDIYSFGMVVWAVALEGKQFQKEYWLGESVGFDQKGAASLVEIQGKKVDDELLRIAVKSLELYLRRTAQTPGPLASSTEIHRFTKILQKSMKSVLSSRWKRLGKEVLRENFEKNYEPAQNSTSGNISEIRLDIDFLYQEYGPGTGLVEVAAAIPRRLIDFAIKNKSPVAYFQASVCFATGLGVDANLSKAVELMATSASLGSTRARGVYHTLASWALANGEVEPQNIIDDEPLIHFDDFGLGNTSDFDIPAAQYRDDKEAVWLYEAAASGSRFAAQQLSERDPSAYQLAISTLKTENEGVGFQLKPLKLIETKGKQKHDPNSVTNKRGDTTLHRAALKGDLNAVKSILAEDNMALNFRNSDGETPFLCAMRSGNESIVEFLFDEGADTSIQDHRGVTSLHWVCSLDEKTPSITNIFKRLSNTPVNTSTTESVIYNDHYGSELYPGTALDWAVDMRVHYAIKALCSMGSDPMRETTGRPSAFHRACRLHDFKIVKTLLQATGMEEESRLDSHGRTALSYTLQRSHLFDRLLISEYNINSLEKTLKLLKVCNADVSYVNSSGENAVYHAIRCEHLAGINAIGKVYQHEPRILQRLYRSVSSWNRWSSIRRAIYAEDSAIFKSLLDRLEVSSGAAKEDFEPDMSTDGLGLLHECSFASKEVGLQCAQHLLALKQTNAGKELGIDVHSRLLKRPQRGRLTPFQLAVLLQKFELADLLVLNSAKPFAGLEGVRFLGWLIQYQQHESDVPSKFLDPITDDPLVAAVRRFPHPVKILPCIQYLLRMEPHWSKRASARQNLYNLDEDPEHDPMIGRRPGLEVAWNMATGLGSNADNLALERFGTTGIMDTNTVGVEMRMRHARAFCSFLLCYRKDAQKEAEYGHPYITALDVGFDMVLKSPYPAQAEKVLLALLDTYKGRQYCTFPYRHYLPFIRPRLLYLRRRETILHRAIRAHKIRIVERLLDSGADWEMANVEWQSPLFLARILARGHDPSLDVNQGTFWQRLSPIKPSITNRERNASTQAAEVRRLLEHKSRTTSARPWPVVRALMEVRWPWDEYEVDGFGIKMFIYYLLIIFAVLVPVAFVVRFIYFSIPSAFVELGDAFGDLSIGLAELGKCYSSTKNSTDPVEFCTMPFIKTWNEYGDALFNLSAGIIGILDACYNESALIDRSVDPLLWSVPGCATKDYNWVEDPAREILSQNLTQATERFLRENSDCRCTWGGKPYLHK